MSLKIIIMAMGGGVSLKIYFRLTRVASSYLYVDFLWGALMYMTTHMPDMHTLNSTAAEVPVNSLAVPFHIPFHQADF